LSVALGNDSPWPAYKRTVDSVTPAQRIESIDQGRWRQRTELAD